mmetsp:Transcript_50132/g.106686  ORF Transcript_50132/g.106686 Transcript_50132/m.106686 type:complete len:212 (+) Transcript_50132:739-1374(+)
MVRFAWDSLLPFMHLLIFALSYLSNMQVSFAWLGLSGHQPSREPRSRRRDLHVRRCSKLLLPRLCREQLRLRHRLPRVDGRERLREVLPLSDGTGVLRQVLLGGVRLSLRKREHRHAERSLLLEQLSGLRAQQRGHARRLQPHVLPRRPRGHVRQRHRLPRVDGVGRGLQAPVPVRKPRGLLRPLVHRGGEGRLRQQRHPGSVPRGALPGE